MNDNRIGSERKWIGCIAWSLGGMAFVALLCGGSLFYTTFSSRPPSVFQRVTGLRWPPNATIVASGSNHSMPTGDGEFYVVFDVPKATIDDFLSSPPASPLSDWQTGPVPVEIGSHCRFGTRGVAVEYGNDGQDRYFGNRKLEDVLGSSAVTYSAHERCCENIAWHNGTLLVVDPRIGRVWLSIWDF